MTADDFMKLLDETDSVILSRKLFKELLDNQKSSKALEQEPCDAISRQYLIDIATKDGAYDYVSAQEIANAPSVNPQSKTGHWICNYEKRYCKCSVCGIGMGHIKYDYCPNCGAKMIKSEDK